MTVHHQAPTFDDVALLVSSMTAKQDAARTYGILDSIVQRRFSHKLLTILRYVEKDMEVERLYSSNSAIYPPLGRKKKEDTVWGRVVLDQGKVLISADADDIRKNFSDFETIFSLGIAGMINVPVAWNGAVLGSINISHEEGHFSEADAEPLMVLAGIIAPLVGGDF